MRVVTGGSERDALLECDACVQTLMVGRHVTNDSHKARITKTTPLSETSVSSSADHPSRTAFEIPPTISTWLRREPHPLTKHRQPVPDFERHGMLEQENSDKPRCAGARCRDKECRHVMMGGGTRPQHQHRGGWNACRHGQCCA